MRDAGERTMTRPSDRELSDLLRRAEAVLAPELIGQGGLADKLLQAANALDAHNVMMVSPEVGLIFQRILRDSRMECNET
jgi:hypothetical protein